MKEASLASLNLNVLVALDALLDTRSVTAAARKVGVSQPAMSRSLKSLRDMFDDPLLVRGKHGLLLTPRAALVREPLRRSLTDLTGVIAGRGDFDPATSTRRFIVEMPDYLMGLLGPALCDRVTREAPGVTLDVRLADRTDIFVSKPAPPTSSFTPVWNHRSACVDSDSYVIASRAPCAEGIRRRPRGRCRSRPSPRFPIA